MMYVKKFRFLLLPFIALLLISTTYDWGFFGHRRINRMAVFTLPPDMMALFKKNIDYLTDHAVDPDKRRYATKHEAVRHYIDIDHWGTYPFDNIPRDWTGVLMKYTDIYLVNSQLDTLRIMGEDIMELTDENIYLKDPALQPYFSVDNPSLSYEKYREYFTCCIQNQYYEEEWKIDCEAVNILLENQGFSFDCVDAYAVDRFSEYGILPYHLVSMQRRLTKAFEQKEEGKILRLAAEFGHYIGDAHVPLHTTENYNGQFTDQVGIHGFWESRIPELFADKNWDYFVGKATYIEDPQSYYWDVVLTSHSYLDSVLLIEKYLRNIVPQDKQFCYDERNNRTIRTQCKAFAAAYNQRMDGMVESRMRKSIQAIGSAWYTAWVDAGEPDLSDFGKYQLSEEERQAQEREDEIYRKGEIKGRAHPESGL